MTDETAAETYITCNRADFTWPYPAERQRIFDWDRYEYKEPRAVAVGAQPANGPSEFRNAETLRTIPYDKKPRFDFDFRPNPISGFPRESVTRYPTEVCKITHRDYGHSKGFDRVRQSRDETKPYTILLQYT